jgi:hypothetical protein
VAKEENLTSILIVGADRINAFVPKLKELGITRVTHWTARRPSVAKNEIPKHVEMVIFFTDFLNHSAARKIKARAKERDLPALFCRRAWSEIICEIECLMKQKGNSEKHLNG